MKTSLPSNSLDHNEIYNNTYLMIYMANRYLQMVNLKYFSIIFLIVLMFFIISCNESWDEHYSIDESNLKENLAQVIQKTENLTKFYEYLVKTGYNKELESSKSYTVWAPVDEAFTNLDPSIVIDSVRLRQLIGYFICLSSNITYNSEIRLKMLNGKYAIINIEDNKIENANIIEGSEIICQNGILHFIDKVYEPKLNTWEYFLDIADGTKQKAFIDKLYAYVFDIENSQVIGVDEQTGLTIYDSVKIWKNSYLLNIANLESEADLYTFIVLSDNAFDEGLNTYKSYYTPADSSIIDSLASYNVCADLVFDDKHLLEDLPEMLVSTTGIIVYIDPAEIDTTVETSNGIVHFMNAFPVEEENKFKPLIIEGENLEKASSNIWEIRNVDSASGNLDLLYDHNTTGSWVQYSVFVPYPAKFEFYWIAVHNDSTTYKQNLEVYNYNPGDNDTALVKFPLVSTTTIYGLELLLGDYTFTQSMNISLRIFSEDITPVPPITLDYIKLIAIRQ